MAKYSNFGNGYEDNRVNNEQSGNAQVDNNGEAAETQENPGFIKAHKKGIIGAVAALIAVVGTVFTTKYLIKRYMMKKAEAEAFIAAAQQARGEEK